MSIPWTDKKQVNLGTNEFVNQFTLNRNFDRLLENDNELKDQLASGVATELATSEEAVSGVITTKAITPSGVTDMFSVSGQSYIGTSGYQKLPSGLIMQWGESGGYSGGEVEVAVTFPLEFPNSALQVTGTIDHSAVVGGSVALYTKTGTLTTTGLTFISDASHSSLTGAKIRWFAIGY